MGFRDGDGEDQIAWMADKVIGLRVFPDAEGKMNLALDEVGGDLLVVSQFTLYGDTRKGRRPSFVDAAPPGARHRPLRALRGSSCGRARRDGWRPASSAP